MDGRRDVFGGSLEQFADEGLEAMHWPCGNERSVDVACKNVLPFMSFPTTPLPIISVRKNITPLRCAMTELPYCDWHLCHGHEPTVDTQCHLANDIYLK